MGSQLLGQMGAGPCCQAQATGPRLSVPCPAESLHVLGRVAPFLWVGLRFSRQPLLLLLPLPLSPCVCEKPT